jgi:hypothetical protein
LSKHGEPPLGEFGDCYCDLGVYEKPLTVFLTEQLSRLVGGPSANGDISDEREGHRAIAPNADPRVEVRLLIDVNLDKVVRTKTVIITTALSKS